MTSHLLKNYPAENYKVLFDPKTGFFARIEDDGNNEPFWASSGPELLDISITNWCDNQCPICYRNSSPQGHHISLPDYRRIMQEASKSNVFQVALGGGNPNQHPNFIELLRMTKIDYGIVPSYTTNGRGLSDDILAATRDYCGAIAISTNGLNSLDNNILKKILKYDIKTNVHFLLNKNTISTAIKWLTSPPSYLDNCNALIFLNYKPVGKAIDSGLLLKHNSTGVKTLFSLINRKQYQFKIGFDSCMVPGILKYLEKFNSTYVEPCEAARFSAFIDENLNMYPCSFMINHEVAGNIKEKSLLEIWKEGKTFQETRNSLRQKKCFECKRQPNCLNGCPFLPQINLCNLEPIT